MSTQAEKATRLRDLHAAPGAFLAGNAWDAGTARLLAHVGFGVVETSSAGVMFARGWPDGDGLASRELMLENARAVARAVDVPVIADLENGFGHRPEDVAETIRLAAETGIVGGSIEDATGDRSDPIYPFDHAVARIRAGAEAARALPFPFLLTARADQFMHGRPDLAEVIRRAQAFEEAGADVILAPGLADKEEIETLAHALDRPLAVIMGLSSYRPSLTELGWIGVKRVSVGSALSRVALTAFLTAAREMREHGTFGFAADAIPFAELNGLFRQLRSSGAEAES
jgi:2-methylisocitrate lyase-like PEP mutase family enzyme